MMLQMYGLTRVFSINDLYSAPKEIVWHVSSLTSVFTADKIEYRHPELSRIMLLYCSMKASLEELKRQSMFC